MKFRKKPVEIKAHRWFRNGDHPRDECRVITPAHGDGEPFLSEGKIVRYFRRPDISGESVCPHCQFIYQQHGWIDTLEGGHDVCPGDWIIEGVEGEFYPCKPRIFEKTYELVK
jgi:hypothetical protein